jgi:hypothetical protein
VPDAEGEVYLEAHVDPWLVLRTAADLYQQGVEGVFLWEAGQTPAVPQRWEILKRLGDREWVTQQFGRPVGPTDGRASIPHLRVERSCERRGRDGVA